MGSRYLLDLADVCRSTGYPVIEMDGWETNARGSGGYDSGRPNHVMVHHTASGPASDPMNGGGDVQYCCYGHQDAPVGNLYLSRDGTVYVMAAGAANTNGTGHDPCGVTPDDSMNSHSLAIEAGNGGTGEPWAEVQQSSYTALCSALCAAYGIPTSRIHAHFEWAPTRKIDPAGQSRYASGSAMWNMDAYRADCGAGGPIPQPPSGDDDVEKILVRTEDGWPYVTDFASYAVGLTEDQAARGRDMRGYSVAADGGPFPLDAQDTDLMHRIAGDS